MGFFNNQKSKERKAFRSIVEKKSTQAARQAFSEEAVKVAAEKAKARARRKSIGEIVADRVRGSVESKASGRTIPTPRASPKRRRVVKRKVTTKRKVNKMRVTPKRKIAKRRAVKATTKSTPTATVQRSPATLNEAMYGGY